MQVADLVLKQQQGVEKYRMKDARLERSLSDLMSTFFSRTFASIMPLILEVLNKMTKEYTKEKETICVSHGRVFPLIKVLLTSSSL